MNTMKAPNAIALVAILSSSLSMVRADETRDLTLQLSHLAEQPGMLYVGEPLDLEARIVNAGGETLRGHFTPAPYGTTTAFYVRPPGGSPIRMDDPYDPQDRRERVDVHRPLQLLRPEQSAKVTVRFVVDPRTRALRIAEPGTYDFFVTLSPNDGGEIRSDAVRVVVSDPSERHRPAFLEYVSAGLAVLVAAPAQRLREEPDVIRAAETFLQSHADSPYGRHVEKALLDGLRSRAFGGDPTPLELEAYQRWETRPNLRRAVGAPQLP
jgi:hypothetical protein